MSRRTVHLYIALLFISSPAQAEKNNENNGDSRYTYTFSTPACSFHFHTKQAGLTNLSGNDGFSSYSEQINRGKFQASINFTCKRKEVSYCRGAWFNEIQTENEKNLITMKIKGFQHVNDKYNAIVYSANMVAVSEPRPRYLYFCMTDADQTLEGRAEVGDENNEQVKEIIAILGAIQFK